MTLVRTLAAPLLVAVGLLLLLFLRSGAIVVAQTGDEEWAAPINLSHSGPATDPHLVVDSSDTLHVIWQDSLAGTVYTRGQGDQWTPPVAVTLPFSGTTSPLVADLSGHIHAVWQNDDGVVLHSQVLGDSFGDPAAWVAPQQVAEAALDVALTVDSTGRLHLSYVRQLETLEAPAGVYYRRSDDGGATWSSPTLLYQSSYIRSLSAENANVEIAATASNQIFVAWDNRSLERVFVTRSPDGGQSWEPPVEVDRRQAGDTPDAIGPSRILVRTSGDEVHLIWQAGHNGATCSQYHQWSRDGGGNWQAPQRFDALAACPGETWLLAGQTGLFFMASLEGVVSLSAWDGSRWSPWQPQTSLSSFVNPDTFRPVSLGCLRPTTAGDGRLLVVGCDTRNAQDIWLMVRSLGAVPDWFPAPPLWQPAARIATSDLSVSDPVSVAGPDGNVHLFWAQADGRAINYSRWDGTSWVPPAAILTTPRGRAEQPAVALTPEGRLLVVWSDGSSGKIYFSQARSERAWIAAEWHEPQEVPISGLAARSPNLLVEPGGATYLAYAVPINEGRGIYLTRFDGENGTWSEPVRVFDAASAAWAWVDSPRLSSTGSGHLQLLWTRYSPPGGDGPLALGYAQSSDGGANWSSPQIVVEAPVAWSTIVGAGERTVHRVWVESDGGRTTMSHEISLDQGLTWTRATAIADSENVSAAVALTLDAIGRPHLVQASGLVLHHSLWERGQWLANESLILDGSTVTAVQRLSAVVAGDGTLIVAFSGPIVSEAGAPMQHGLYSTRRSIEYPAEVPTPLPTLTVTPSPEPTTTPVPAPSPTATPAFPTGGGQTAGSPQPGNNRSSWLTMGIIPAALLVFVVILLRVRVARSERY